jgi:hypothetical protein
VRLIGEDRGTWPNARRWPASAQFVEAARPKFSSRYDSPDGILERPSIGSSAVSPGLIPMGFLS